MPSSHIALHTEWQHMLHSFSAKAWLAGPLYICASNVLTQSIIAVFCLLLLSPTQLNPPSLTGVIIEVALRSGRFPLRGWQRRSAQATDILRKPF